MTWSEHYESLRRSPEHWLDRVARQQREVNGDAAMQLIADVAEADVSEGEESLYTTGHPDSVKLG